MSVMYIAFKHGTVWNITEDEETVKDWFERRVIEGYQTYKLDLTASAGWHHDYPGEWEENN